MPIGDLDLITVTGTLKGSDNTVAVGTVTFEIPDDVWFVQDPGSNLTVIPKRQSVALDATGFFSIAVPATDDPDVTPTGWFYWVTFDVFESSGGRRTFPLEVPLAAGPTVDFADLPIPQTPGGVTYGATPSQLSKMRNDQVGTSISNTGAMTSALTVPLVLGAGELSVGDEIEIVAWGTWTANGAVPGSLTAAVFIGGQSCWTGTTSTPTQDPVAKPWTARWTLVVEQVGAAAVLGDVVGFCTINNPGGLNPGHPSTPASTSLNYFLSGWNPTPALDSTATLLVDVRFQMSSADPANEVVCRRASLKQIRA